MKTRMTAGEAYRQYFYRGQKIAARMPEGGSFYAVTVERADGDRIRFDAGWGSCTLERGEMVEVERLDAVESVS